MLLGSQALLERWEWGIGRYCNTRRFKPLGYIKQMAGH
jgi:hypothetical protein